MCIRDSLDGCHAHGVGTLAEAERWILTQDFDVLLLDLGLPDGDGLEWLLKQKTALAPRG